MSLSDLPIPQLGRMLRARAVSAVEIAQSALARIEKHEDSIHAFVRLTPDLALNQARSADMELSKGVDRGPMHGIPYALKDIFDVQGLPTTCQSRLRLDHCAKRDSTVAARFRSAGGVLLGKLATFEFAIGGPSTDLPFPPAANPWNTERITGGSSSGSAAAIAAGYVRVAMGSCTAGSIRGPAAWCGAVGLKPTFGRVDRFGAFPLAPSLDHCGPLARSVEEAAMALQIVASDGDPDLLARSAGSLPAELNRGTKGLRIKVPRAFFENSSSLTADAGHAIEKTLSALANDGAVVETVALPDYAVFLACCRVIMTAEMYAIHRGNLRRRIEDYGELTARRCLAGCAIDTPDYLHALELKRHLRAAVNAALQGCDALVTAISLGTAPKVEAKPEPLGWPLQASPFNVTGHPALSVPIGLGKDGMPLAIQIVGRHFDEATVLRVGRSVERLSGWESVPLPKLPEGA